MSVLFIILAFFLVLALYWEYKDYHRLYRRPNIYSLRPERRHRELTFYGCYNYENKVEWRLILIGAIISSFFIWYLLKQFGYAINNNVVILVFLIILSVFYILSTFKTFHLYRVMCSKIKPELNIL